MNGYCCKLKASDEDWNYSEPCRCLFRAVIERALKDAFPEQYIWHDCVTPACIPVAAQGTALEFLFGEYIQEICELAEVSYSDLVKRLEQFTGVKYERISDGSICGEPRGNRVNLEMYFDSLRRKREAGTPGTLQKTAA